MAGFIGSHLAETLLQRRDSVLGIDSFTSYYPQNIKLANLAGLRVSDNFTFVEADLSEASLAEYVKDIDVVFHLAAQPGVRASWGETFASYLKNNVAATQRLLEACKGTKLKRFIYASSSSIYGDAERFPTPEEAVPRPLSPYGATKLEAEYLCDIYFRNFGVPTVTLRYFTVYGPRQRPDMAFNKFIEAIGRKQEVLLYGDGEQKRDFTFVSDTVAATLLAAEAEAGSVYNVGTGSVVSVNEVLSLIGRITGREPKVRMMPKAPGDVLATCADTSRIRKDLGFGPTVEIEAGLRQQVAAQLGM